MAGNSFFEGVLVLVLSVGCGLALASLKAWFNALLQSPELYQWLGRWLQQVCRPYSWGKRTQAFEVCGSLGSLSPRLWLQLKLLLGVAAMGAFFWSNAALLVGVACLGVRFDAADDDTAGGFGGYFWHCQYRRYRSGLQPLNAEDGAGWGCSLGLVRLLGSVLHPLWCGGTSTQARWPRVLESSSTRLGGVSQGAWVGVFADSGAWDSVLATAFERLYRGLVLSVGGWLLAHALTERIGDHVLRERAEWAGPGPARQLTHTWAFFGGLLGGVVVVLGALGLLGLGG